MKPAPGSIDAAPGEHKLGVLGIPADGDRKPFAKQEGCQRFADLRIVLDDHNMISAQKNPRTAAVTVARSFRNLAGRGGR